MSGFFVSNSFGTFNSEETTKKFNAVTLTGFPDGVTSISGKNMRKQMRTAQPPNQYLYSGTAGNKKGSGWAHMYENDWLPESDSVFFNRWTSNDAAVMRDDEDSMQYFRPAKNVRMKVKIGFYDCTLGSTDYNYTTYELGIPSEYVTKSGHREFVEVWLDGNNDDYIFIDFDDDLNNNTFDQPVLESTSGAIYAVVIKCEEGVWTSHHDPDADYCSTVTIQPLEAVYTKEGCTDSEATNYDSTAGVNVGCTYARAVPTLTLNKTEVREGSPVKISWSLDNSGNKGYTKIELYDGNTKIKTSYSKNSYYNYTPTGIRNHPISIKVIWDHGVQPPDQRTNLSVVDAVTYITCTDPNRNKDANNECADCKSGYYLGTDGLCTNCEMTNDDQYRDMDATTGQCTGCVDGYAEDTDGTCQQVGCMTYNDGSPVGDGDYDYDKDNKVNDTTMCEFPDGPEGAANGGNGGTADVDCELSDWSDWSAWSQLAAATDGGDCGTRTRTRTVVTDSGGNGAVCEHLEEEEVKDCSTGEIVTNQSGGGGSAPAPEPKSLAAPLIIGGIVLTIGYLVMRR